MKKALVFLIVSLKAMVVMSQGFMPITSLYGCSPLQMLGYKNNLFLVTEKYLYELNNDAWVKISNGYVRKVAVANNIIVGITFNGVCYSEISNTHKYNWNNVLDSEEHKKINSNGAFVCTINDSIFLIDDYALYYFDTKTKTALKKWNLPTMENRICFVRNDTIYIGDRSASGDLYIYNFRYNDLKKIDISLWPKPYFDFHYSNGTTDYLFGYDSITVSKENQATFSVKVNFSAVSIVGTYKYRDGVLIAVNRQGVYYFNEKAKSIEMFNEKINEAFVDKLFVKDSVIFCANYPYRYSTDLGRSWRLSKIKYWSLCEVFKNKLILGENEKLYDADNGNVLHSFKARIITMVSFRGLLLVTLTDNKIYATKNLNTWIEVADLKNFINGHCSMFLFQNRLLFSANYGEYYEISNPDKSYFFNNPLIRKVKLIPDLKILVNNGKRIKIKDKINMNGTTYELSSFQHIFNDAILIRYSDGLLYSKDGITYHPINHGFQNYGVFCCKNKIYIGTMYDGIFIKEIK